MTRSMMRKQEDSEGSAIRFVALDLNAAPVVGLAGVSLNVYLSGIASRILRRSASGVLLELTECTRAENLLLVTSKIKAMFGVSQALT